MASVTLTWHTMKDDRVCPVCRDLEGYPWVFEVGKDTFTNALTHPIHGLVWSIGIGSQAHGHRGNCRCHVESQFEFADLLAKVTEITERLEQAVAVGEQKGDEA